MPAGSAGVSPPGGSPDASVMRQFAPSHFNPDPGLTLKLDLNLNLNLKLKLRLNLSHILNLNIGLKIAASLSSIRAYIYS